MKRLICFLFFVSPCLAIAVPTGSPIIVDAIVATVDEKPITLQDLKKRLPGTKSLTLEDASNDAEIRALLERMILEQAILAEAENRKMSVSQGEVDRYLDEVAKHNNMSREALLKALADEKKDIGAYREQIKVDILQSRLTSVYLQGSAAISHEEVSAYLKDHPELTLQGSHVKIRRIFIDPTKHSSEQLQEQVREAKSLLDKGEDFGTVAKKYSDGAEASDGGLLGVVAEKELSPELFDALLALKPGDVSPVLTSDSGLQIIKLEERYMDEKQANEQITEEVKKRLQAQKMESKMQTFFTTELFKHHTVDKKI